MNLAVRTVDLEVVRTDGGTQVRDGLDEAWVRELMALYEEDHEIAPILLVRDPEGVHWIADGFHRLEAQRRLGRGSVQATVRGGPAMSLDAARMLAAQANKNGRPLLPGEKRRAVLLARSTPEGAKMRVVDLAKHCGVAKGYVSEILDAERRSVENAALVVGESSAAYRPSYARLYARVDEAILRADPTRKSVDITRETGARSETIAKARARLGQAPAARGASPPTAPARKGGDARDDAEVIVRRPAEPAKPEAPPPPKSSPRPSPTGGYSSTAARDTAHVALHNVDRALESLRDGDRELFLEQLALRTLVPAEAKG